jgi:hypothetical protein
MIQLRLVGSAFLVAFLVGLTVAADAVPIESAHGIIEKADKDHVVIQPRTADGKFGKALSLKITGTSRITTLVPQMRDGKVVLTQRDTDAKDLQPKQPVSVLYATLKEGHVLLSAVVEPTPGK